MMKCAFLTDAALAASSHSIRRASPSDLAALARLIARSSEAAADPPIGPAVAALFSRGHLFVLDAVGGELGAAVHVELGPDMGHLDLLVVDLALRGRRLESRLIHVAEAFCPWGRLEKRVTAPVHARTA